MTPTSEKAKREPWVWIFAATGGMLLIALGIFVWSVFQSAREGGRVTTIIPTTAVAGSRQQYEILGRFNPPAYTVARNNAAEPPDFEDAMRHYSNRDYAGALSRLEAAVKTHPDLLVARLYLGICRLYNGNRDGGVEALRGVVAEGNTPYVEQARFYLAKGLIGSGDAAGARHQLDELIAMHGEMAQQAEALLARIK